MNNKFPFIFTIVLFCMSTSLATAADLSGKVSPQGLRRADNILVYLTKTPEFSKPPQNEFVMDQNDLTFLPHVLVIPRDGIVSFPNSDKVAHNVFSLSRTKKFNFGSYKPGQSHKVTFDKPGIVELRCDVHAEMIAYILVMKSPYYALTDKKGYFKIDITDLDTGKYYLKTWHEKLKNSRIALDLTQADSKAMTIKLKRGAPGVLYK